MAFKRACDAAQIDDFTIHGLRHTFASHLVMSGVDLATVSRLMGHTSISMTMVYAHLSPRHEADAVAKLEGKLEQSRNVSDLGSKKVVNNQPVYEHTVPHCMGENVDVSQNRLQSGSYCLLCGPGIGPGRIKSLPDTPSRAFPAMVAFLR